eukprot:9462749-Pyramimonas_sp.AAC.1
MQASRAPTRAAEYARARPIRGGKGAYSVKSMLTNQVSGAPTTQAAEHATAVVASLTLEDKGLLASYPA